LALEYATMVRRVETFRNQCERSLANRGLLTRSVMESIVCRLAEDEQEVTSRLIGTWFLGLTVEQQAAFTTPAPCDVRSTASTVAKPPLVPDSPPPSTNPPAPSTSQARVPAPPKHPKRSTDKGEARDKIVAALTKHHKYNNGSVENREPIGCNELARQAV